MATRNVRLCDKPACDGKFLAVCPLCDQDCCSTHYSATAGVQIAIVVGDHLLATTVTGICGYCRSALDPRLPMPFPGPPALPVPYPSPVALPQALPQASFPLPPPLPTAMAPPALPLDHVVVAMRPHVIEAVRAFMADKMLSRTG